MASFCDIPLKYCYDNNYGKYGIAMSRKWGIEHLLQPVLYYPNNKDCQSTQIIMKATENFLNNKEPDEYRILGYSKPICKIEKNISYISKDNYAEREWRKVYASQASFKWKTEAEYATYRGSSGSPKKQVGSPLKFSPSDVTFIIVGQLDVKPLIDFIMRGNFNYIGGKEKHTVTTDDRELLLSKIVSYEDLCKNL